MAETKTRVLLIEPDDGEAERIARVLYDLGTYDVVRALTLAEAIPHLTTTEVIISALNLPDVGQGTEALKALCAARPPGAPGVVVVIDDARDEACTYAWQRSYDCVQDILFRNQLNPEQLSKAVREACEMPGLARKGEDAEAARPGRHAYAVGFPVEGVGSKLDQTLEQNRKILEELREIKFAQAQQSHRFVNLEADVRKTREEQRRAQDRLRRMAHRLKTVSSELVGDSTTGLRPLRVRVEDVERDQRHRDAAQAGWRNLLNQGAVQLAPVIVTVLGALFMFYLTHQTQQAVERALAAPPYSAPAK